MKTNEEIDAEIESLTKRLTDPRIVTPEEMDRLYPVYGSEQAIKNYKKSENDKIEVEITRLTGLLTPPE